MNAYMATLTEFELMEHIYMIENRIEECRRQIKEYEEALMHKRQEPTDEFAIES